MPNKHPSTLDLLYATTVHSSLHCSNGTPQQRTKALQTLGSDHTFRTMRVTHDLMTAVGRRLPAAAPAAEGQPQRTIYNAHTTTNLPGDTVRIEGAGPTGDPAEDEAYDGLGDTYNFYWQAYQRNSIDDQGLPLNAIVHFDQNYDNAFWNGERMVFGDGDGDLFNRFTISVDVIGHELTHGVTGDEAKLVYLNQPGALNESISDVFGSLVKQFALNQTSDQADWLIGAGLFTAKVHGVALRSMKEPGTAYDDSVLGTDPQSATMQSYVQTSDDNGGYILILESPTMPLLLPPYRLVDTPGRRLGGSGTKHCVIHAYDQPPAFEHSLA